MPSSVKFLICPANRVRIAGCGMEFSHLFNRINDASVSVLIAAHRLHLALDHAQVILAFEAGGFETRRRLLPGEKGIDLAVRNRC
jgi:hypothetical protein